MSRTKLQRFALPLAGLALLAGCARDDQTILTATQSATEPLFERYVSMGNSITAGYQSGGINDSTQLQSYAVLLAARANATFNVPLLSRPGCPPPYTAPLGSTGRVGGGTETTCLVRVSPQLNRPVQNVAVPGAVVGSLFNNAYAANVLTTLFLGNRTQVQAMQDAQPTFVSAWIGNNDALGAATSGILGPVAAGADSLLTPLAKFRVRLDSVVAGIKGSTAKGAVLVGVVDAGAAAPLLQPGAFFYLARDAAGRFQGKPVDASCSPVTALGQPNPLSRNLISFQAVGDASIATITCDPTANGGRYVLDTNEQAVVRQRIIDYNAYIQSVATANGWAYLDPNTVLTTFLNQTTNVTVGGQTYAVYNQIRKCQLLRTAATPAQFQDAVIRSCPVTAGGSVPAALVAPNFFGALFSFDGVHPSAAAHVVLANELAKVINAKYGTKLATS